MYGTGRSSFAKRRDRQERRHDANSWRGGEEYEDATAREIRKTSRPLRKNVFSAGKRRRTGGVRQEIRRSDGAFPGGERAAAGESDDGVFRRFV